MTTGIFADYLRRLGVTGPHTPSVEGLFALQRAHLERVPYENIDIQLGRPPAIDPEVSARRFGAGRGGYCFHLNGGFAALLDRLGYDVTLHVGGVSEEPEVREVNGNHLTLTVRLDGAAYFVDAGLGDGPHEPLPLREGSYEQGGFLYRLERLDGAERGWTFHNTGGPFPVMSFRSAPAVMADFAEEHRRLSTEPDSQFLRTLSLLRRDAKGIDLLRGRVLSRIDADKGPVERELDGPEEFFDVLAGVFGRELDDLTPADRAELWARVDRAHEAWLASRQV